MAEHHDYRFPNESDEYRKARDELLAEERGLREKLEQIAAMRRQLPGGGKLKEDYLFDEGPLDLNIEGETRQTPFSELFDDRRSNLLVYSFMFAEDADTPCPACTSMIDGLNGSAAHIRDRVNFAVVAKAPLEKFRSWARSRGWHNLRLLSSQNNSYNRDYFGENADASQQLPAMNVFRRKDGDIYHFYCTELLFTAPEEHQHPRHADLFWPIWALFDLTPDGRGTDWFPRYHYDD